MVWDGEHMDNECFWALWEVVFKGKIACASCKGLEDVGNVDYLTICLIPVTNENLIESRRFSARSYHN